MSISDKLLLLLRAFPLSISILLRFLPVLPFWVVVYFVMTVVALAGSLQLAVILPFVGFVVLMILSVLAIAITFVISIHPYLIGIKIGLGVLNIETGSSQKRLLGGAVGFGFLEAIVAAILLGVVFVFNALLIERDFGLLSSIYVDPIPDPVATLSRQISIGVVAFLPILSSLVVMALRAALLPAMANYVVGRAPSGRSRTNLDGFGANFVTMILLMLMITAVSTVLLPYLGSAFRYLGLTTALRDGLTDIVLFAFDEQDMSFTITHAVMLVVTILVSVWLFCLQCAGAALSYEGRVVELKKNEQIKAESAPDLNKSMAELRRSRMPRSQQ